MVFVVAAHQHVGRARLRQVAHHEDLRQQRDGLVLDVARGGERGQRLRDLRVLRDEEIDQLLPRDLGFRCRGLHLLVQGAHFDRRQRLW